MNINIILSCYKDDFLSIAKEIKIYTKNVVELIIKDYPNFNLVQEINLSLAFVDNKQIQQLNYQWRGIDKPTDVLSFPNFTDIHLAKPFVNCTLGDVIIDIPYSQIDARDLDVPLLMHLVHLMVHGVLHLFGYDHQNDHDESIMNLKTLEIMHYLGFDKFKII